MNLVFVIIRQRLLYRQDMVFQIAVQDFPVLCRHMRAFCFNQTLFLQLADILFNGLFGDSDRFADRPKRRVTGIGLSIFTAQQITVNRDRRASLGPIKLLLIGSLFRCFARLISPDPCVG